MARKNIRLKCAAAAIGVLGGGGYMLQATGCIAPFMTESFATATDFCFIFDCQNGLFGGTIDPCSRQTINGEVAQPFFADCPTQ